MTERLLLGIDVGTTQIKGAVFNLDGRQRAAAAVTYPLHRPHPGWAEQDPEDWWRATLNVIARIGEQAPLREVAALGVCSQVNTHVLLDAAGRALLPAITWQDQRCAEIAAALDGSIDARRRAPSYGTPSSPSTRHSRSPAPRGSRASARASTNALAGCSRPRTTSTCVYAATPRRTRSAQSASSAATAPTTPECSHWSTAPPA